jgi:hypothetical protein
MFDKGIEHSEEAHIKHSSTKELDMASLDPPKSAAYVQDGLNEKQPSTSTEKVLILIVL